MKVGNLSFEALTKTVTPLLAKQACDLIGEDIKDVQEVLERLFEDIRAGKSGMAGRVSAAWAKQRSIDLYRKRPARFEGAFARKEPPMATRWMRSPIGFRARKPR